ncbi:MAG TPA: hypothetical protein VGV07_04100 [Devosia sp.]|uniref:hypothetical protein n=1 Tax=Devosia sp. TaxID=1871048 RepID=UPI002DDD25E2|nr:hypothetical protein [Devosia sp.]HEV2514407.1 hypothetical protein [Devosia sp.]
MPKYSVTLYDFRAKPPSVTLPQTVEAAEPMSAARQLTGEELVLNGHFVNLVAEVTRHDGKVVAQRVMFYRKP